MLLCWRANPLGTRVQCITMRIRDDHNDFASRASVRQPAAASCCLPQNCGPADFGAEGAYFLPAECSVSCRDSSRGPLDLRQRLPPRPCALHAPRSPQQEIHFNAKLLRPCRPAKYLPAKPFAASAPCLADELMNTADGRFRANENLKIKTKREKHRWPYSTPLLPNAVTVRPKLRPRRAPVRGRRERPRGSKLVGGVQPTCVS